jgi:lipopolysaccharide transport system permease protein
MDITNDKHDEKWDLHIRPSGGPLTIGLHDVWRYRDLLVMFVRRDVVTVYKQTILGPIWFFLQPVLTTAMFMFVFGNLAGLSTDGVPQLAFYLAGITVWNYFSETLTSTSKVFTENANIFGKVYFPRLVMPLSKVLSGLIKYGIQMVLFLPIWAFYWYQGKLEPNAAILLLPLHILLMAGLGLGFGLITSSLTTKYRDLTFLISFGVQLLMYATPVIYPLSSLPENIQNIIRLNPLTSILEAFKYGFLGKGELSIAWLAYSCIFTVILLLLGAVMFNKVEKKFVDTV